MEVTCIFSGDSTAPWKNLNHGCVKDHQSCEKESKEVVPFNQGLGFC